MKQDIHPKMNTNVTVTCACGNTFVTQSTLDSIKVDICRQCHPFYTGKQKFIDTEGRIDKFNKKVQFAKEQPTKDKKSSSSSNKVQKTYKEILEDAKSQQKKEEAKKDKS